MEKANQLQEIVSKSGLDTTKSKYILEKFKDAFEFASKWEERPWIIRGPYLFLIWS